MGSGEGCIEDGLGGVGQDPQVHEDGGLLACGREVGAGLGQPKGDLLVLMWARGNEAGSLQLKHGGSSKGPGKKIKALGNVPTPLVTQKKLLAVGGGPGIFVFFVGDQGEEVAAPILEESSLDISALGEEGVFCTGARDYGGALGHELRGCYGSVETGYPGGKREPFDNGHVNS